jgi:hypothetical protein
VVEEVVDLKNKVFGFDRQPDFADKPHPAQSCKVYFLAPFV